MNLLNILRVASITAEKSLRQKILYLIFFFGLVLIALSNFLNVFGLGAQIRLIKDFSLTGINLFGLIFTIAIYLNSIPNEIEQKTIYPLLAKPLRRSEYVWGKFLGNYYLIFLNMLILAVELFLILKLNTNIYYFNVFNCIFLYFIQCGVVGAMVLAFSTRISYPLTLSLTLFAYIIGGFSSVYIQYLAAQPENQIGVFIIKIIKDIIPHFDYFNIKNSVVHDYIIEPKYLPMTAFYGITYIWLFIILAEMSLRNKDL
ncbi:MAG: ABC transporter permease subunit [Armatimonadetes bacterium]|nr:ABC transporter permease subunit [Armatimonadota bacterium]